VRGGHRSARNLHLPYPTGSHVRIGQTLEEMGAIKEPVTVKPLKTLCQNRAERPSPLKSPGAIGTQPVLGSTVPSETSWRRRLPSGSQAERAPVKLLRMNTSARPSPLKSTLGPAASDVFSKEDCLVLNILCRQSRAIFVLPYE
jgi:hypothetical protein